jgi:hypothetical protein
VSHRRRRSARTAKWFAAYTLVMLALAVVSFLGGEYSVGFTILLTAIVFALLTWHLWRKSRASRPAG